MRERAAREARATAVNSRKLNAEWLQRMRTSKLEELHAEAGSLSREHDAQVDRYDRLIEVRAAGLVFTLCPPAAKLQHGPSVKRWYAAGTSMGVCSDSSLHAAMAASRRFSWWSGWPDSSRLEPLLPS